MTTFSIAYRGYVIRSCGSEVWIERDGFRFANCYHTAHARAIIDEVLLPCQPSI